jgi:hypothetical protein
MLKIVADQRCGFLMDFIIKRRREMNNLIHGGKVVLWPACLIQTSGPN